MKTSLERMGVNTEGIRISRTEQTGVALITLDSSAENSIVVCPGANGTVDSDEILGRAGGPAGAEDDHAAA